MARKARTVQDPASDDDAPEVISRLTSEANAEQSQKTLRDAEMADRARRKARNRERDQKLKERARLTKGGTTREKKSGVRAVDGALGKDIGEGDAEMRMLRAMREAKGEMESVSDEDDADSREEASVGFGGPEQGTDSDEAFEENGSMDSEVPTDEEMDEEEEETVPLGANIQKSSRKANYLSDDLFAAAFAVQNSRCSPKKETEAIQQQTVKKRRRRSTARPKDLVTGGRAIRTLPKPLDARLQASTRSIPSARAQRFMDESLAMEGKRAILKAKRRGWERRPANVGVMKYEGAPHGFARSGR